MPQPVRHFRQILIWPLQVMPIREGAQIQEPWDILQSSQNEHSWRELKDKFGGREIAMCRLQDWLVEALNAENLTITAATKHPAFSLLDRQRLQTWQRRLYVEIESVAELLLPAR